MTTPIYDKSNPSSIESFGRRLIGSTLKKKVGVEEIPLENLKDTEGVHFKGKFGKMVETYYYGINPKNEPCSPDFVEAGVELKTNSLKKGKKGLSATQRLSLSLIDYEGIVSESFESSCFMKKNQSMMLISRRYKRDGVLADSRIDLAVIVKFNELPISDQQIIKDDWYFIRDKIRRGEAHLLSGSDTKYLEAATKGGVGADRVNQPNSVEKARPRGFAFKIGLVTSVIRRYLKDDPESLADDEQLAITNASAIEANGFEEAITDRFASFLGLTVDEIETRVGVSLNRNNKAYKAILARRMLGVTTRKIAEFERAGIEMKTIQIGSDGSPKQHMSFPAFRYQGEGSILTEDWDSVEVDLETDEDSPERGDMPKIKRTFEERRFLFLVFKGEGPTQILSHVRFWSMPKDEIERYVGPVWQQTHDLVSIGVFDKFPKTSFNQICHVRPHGNTGEVFPTLRNGDQPKKSFWLDKRYIQAQIA